LVLFAFISFSICQIPPNPNVQTAAVISTDRLRVSTVAYFPSILNARLIDVRSLSIAKSKVSGFIDASEFVMDDLNQTTVYFSYFAAAANLPNGINMAPTAAVATAFVTALRLFAIFEWEDHNGVPGFQDNSTDTIIGIYDLSNPNLAWDPITVTTTLLLDANNNTFRVAFITASTTDKVFFMRLTVAEQPIMVAGIRITPDIVKLDFGTRWYNPLHVPAVWTTGPSNSTLHPNAYVGILGVQVAAFGVATYNSNGNTGGNSSVVIGSNGFQGAFTWSNNASVTIQGAVYQKSVYGHIEDVSTSMTVNVNFAAAFKLKIIFLSYDGIRPDFVYHDPTFGAEIDYTQVDAASTASPTAASTVSTTKKADSSSIIFSLAILLACLFLNFM